MSEPEKTDGDLRRDEYDRLFVRAPNAVKASIREIEYRSTKPQQIVAQISLVEYFERMKQHRADAWQIDLCKRLQAAAEGRHIERWWAIIHAEGQAGKPLDVDTPILKGDGTYVPLGQIEVGQMVISGSGIRRRVTAVHEQGQLDTVRITTHGGREVVAALDHPFLTPDGWVNAGDLVPGQCLGSVSRAATSGTCHRPIEDFEMVGYFIGDGCVTATKGSIQANITSGDEVQAARILQLATKFGWGWRVSKKPGAKCLTHNFKGGVRDWIRRAGIAGCSSFTKRVPNWVFRGSNKQVAAFLGAYFSCDGSITVRGIKEKSKAIDFYSVSKELLQDVQSLLLRFGIQSYLRTKLGTYNGGSHTSYRLYFCSQDSNRLFANQIPVYGTKGQMLRDHAPSRRSFESTILADPIVQIEPSGLRECRCLTVDQDATFTAADLIVHNTSIISQSFPAWLIGHDPLFRYALAMYNQSRSVAHSKVVINMLQTKMHREIFPNRDGWLFEDEVEAGSKAVASKGWKTVARREMNDGQESFNPVGLRSGLTGAGFDWLSIDDPYKESQEAFSELINQQMHNFYDYTVLSRAGLHSCISGMFHRYAPEDFGGFLLDKGDFEYLRYASQADGDYVHPSTGQRFPDPLGRAEGQYLLPERRPAAYYEKARKNNRVWLSMYQGKPSSDEGDFFNVKKLVSITPEQGRARLHEIVAKSRSYDQASTEDAGAASVGVKMGIRPSGGVTLFHGWRDQVGTEIKLAKQKELALLDGTDTVIVIPRDPGAAGVDVVYHTTAMLQGYTVVARATTASKVTRAYNLSIAVNSGQVEYVNDPDDPENDLFVAQMKRELRDFPLSTSKDIVDAMADGYNHLFETSRRGTVVKNFVPQRNLVSVDAFNDFFDLKTFEIPEKWTVYVGVKISQEASRPSSAVIVARASVRSNLPETLFVLDEYKAYDANMYALFDWVSGRMKAWAPDREATVWLHPDSEQFYQTIGSKMPFRVSKFMNDELAGHNELNWYLLPTEKAHPFGATQEASHLYFLVNRDQLSVADPDSTGGFFHARQEMATWGFNEKGDPTKVGQVVDCLRMITHRFKTYEEPLTIQEEYEIEVRRMAPIEYVISPADQHQQTWARYNAKRLMEEKYGEGALDDVTEPEYEESY